MKLVGVGTDLTQVARIERALARRGQKLAERLFTPAERAGAPASKPGQYFAGRFAAKEAVLKILGTGWGSRVPWVAIEVLRAANGAPEVHLHGEALVVARELGIEQIHLSVSHDAGLALAFAVAEGHSR